MRRKTCSESVSESSWGDSSDLMTSSILLTLSSAVAEKTTLSGPKCQTQAGYCRQYSPPTLADSSHDLTCKNHHKRLSSQKNPMIECSPLMPDRARSGRSEERRVGKECRSR